MFLVALSCAGFPVATAEQYWIAWEGDDFPENQGWERVWGNWDGQYEGPGAIRTLEDGILTYDSLYDDGVYDFSKMNRPGQMDPDPGELFIVEWRLKIDHVVGYTDPGVGITSDEAWLLGLAYGYDRIYSVYEDYAVIPIDPGMFHSYRIISPDMRDYHLYVDGELAHHGAFWHWVGASQITWGEGTQGAASVHRWDYFRFGAVPEPSSALLLGLSLLIRRDRR